MDEVEGTPPDGTTVGEGTEERGERDGHRPVAPVTQQVGRVALVVIAGLFVIFAVANAQPVDFSWLVGETEVVERGGEHVRGGVPLIALLIGAFLAGAAVATLLGWQRRRRHR